jgi:hypothetical protein
MKDSLILHSMVFVVWLYAYEKQMQSENWHYAGEVESGLRGGWTLCDAYRLRLMLRFDRDTNAKSREQVAVR